jgi:hypothetical protein
MVWTGVLPDLGPHSTFVIGARAAELKVRTIYWNAMTDH